MYKRGYQTFCITIISSSKLSLFSRVNKQQKVMIANIVPLPCPKSLENEKKYENWNTFLLNKKKQSYNLSFSSKNMMYVILGTLSSSLVSTNAVKPKRNQIEMLLFCFQNWSDLLLEKIVVVIEKNFWNSFKTVQFLKTDFLKTWSWRFLRSNTFRQLEFKLKKMIGN